jgi:hypothetical protein
MTKTLKIRFNTLNTGSLFWRVIIDGEEHLADEIQINVKSYTTKDILPTGEKKWHISVDYQSLEWNDKILIIN